MQLIVDPTPPPSAAPAEGSATGTASASEPAGAELFRSLLATTLTSKPSVPTPAAGTESRASGSSASDDTALQALTAKITKMLDAGASPADIVTSLAAQLAASVAKTLKTPGAQARGQLQTAFAAALAPPGTGSDESGPAAGRIAQLAQRFLQLGRAAGSIATQQVGQQKRIAGNLLDAQRAKDIPARTTTNSTTQTAPAASVAQNPAATAQIDAALAGASLMGAAPVVQNADKHELGTRVSHRSATTSARSGSDATAGTPSAIGGPSNLIADASNVVAVASNAVAVASNVVAVASNAVAVSSNVVSSASKIIAGASNRTAGTSGLAAFNAKGVNPNGETSSVDLLSEAAGAVSSAPAGGVAGRPATAASSVNGADQSLSADALLLAAATGAGLPTRAVSFEGANVTPAKRGVQAVSVNSISASVTAGKTSGAGAAGAVEQTGAVLVDAAQTLSPGDLPPTPNIAALALGAPALSVTPPATSSGAGDGRSVVLGSVAATQTGGDTGLGRILTRAALLADARSLPIDASAPPQSTDTETGSTGNVAAVSADTVAPNAAVAAFVQAFGAALKAAAPTGGTRAEPRDSQAPLTLPLPAQDANSAQAFVPAVAPFAIDRAGASPAPAAPVVPVDHSAIADQVLRGAFMRNVGESSEMRLTLMPDSLGDVSVKLVVNAGTVTAHVVAETSEVRDALVAAQPQLTKSLAESGLKLTSFTVDLSGNGFAGFSQQNDQSQNGNRSRRGTHSTDVDGITDDASLEAIPSFAPASITKPGAGYYSYLA